jgi:uncharacterized repeat protein (TIGR03803 family)
LIYHSLSALGERMKNVFFCVLLVLASCVFTLGQTYKVLYNFGSSAGDGIAPFSNLVFDKAGDMYGTTSAGGAAATSQCGGGGCGTVFELSPNADGTWTETVLYSFCAAYPTGSCPDGRNPTAGLAIDAAGNLYGTTYYGGAVYCPSNSQGCGTVFELSPPESPSAPWTQTVLHSFCSDLQGINTCLDGIYAPSHLTLDNSGNLYGTTISGGNGGWMGGTVFELSPNAGGWTETVLYNFCTDGTTFHCSDGTGPLAGVTFDQAGNIYGTTQAGGTPMGDGGGTVFELSPSAGGWAETTLMSLYQGDNELKKLEGVISFDSAGNLYSTAFSGGTQGFGGVFKLDPQTGTGRQFLFTYLNQSGPAAGVLVDPKTGAVYGTTSMGDGTVFEIGRDGKQTLLHLFCQQPNCTDGGGPAASPSAYSGNLYGTTVGGGTGNGNPGSIGAGVVFELTP